MPALLTRISSRPYCFTTELMPASTCASLATSMATPMAEPLPEMASSSTATAKELEAISGKGSAIGVAMDVANEAQVDAGINSVVKQYGRLDILVSNAGIQTVAPLDEFDFGKWKQLLA